MRILLTGGSGQLGQEILKHTPKGIQLINPNRNKLDLSDYDACKNYVREHRPDWIINCGAYTSVDEAEENIEVSSKINSFAPKAFAETISETNGNLLQLKAQIMFLMENRVFPYEVDQQKNPISQYGQSKALGEDLIKKISRILKMLPFLGLVG